ncbi:MAG: GNAT family N-acetyltransferase [Chloroflexi bacterium]|nr:GNAT family N-acetyltransferase [Chloroflexota bacterium]
MSVIIRPFAPRDQLAARRLILNGLGEHFGWIDETRNPDLDDIDAHYIRRGNAFVVAESGGEIVGTGGLIAVDARTARIVRMSVSRAQRRNGIGRALVTHLLGSARQRGCARVIVFTEHNWDAAINLYSNCGFAEYARDQVDIYFAVALIRHSERSEESHSLQKHARFFVAKPAPQNDNSTLQ